MFAFLLPCAAFAAAGNIYDVSVADYPRLAGEGGDTARIMRAVESAGKSGETECSAT